jgi:hypothetical protein
MPLTIDEQIAAEAYLRLQNCEGVVEVVRVARRIDDWVPKDHQIVLTKTPAVRFTAYDCPGNPPAIGRQVNLKIYCHVLQSIHDTEPADKAIGEFADSAIKAITEVVDWYQFGGVAINAEVGDVARTTQDGFESASVTISVMYRVSETNPFQVRA